MKHKRSKWLLTLKYEETEGHFFNESYFFYTYPISFYFFTVNT